MYCLVQVFTNNSSDTNAYTLTDFKSAIHHIVLKGRGCFTSRGSSVTLHLSLQKCRSQEIQIPNNPACFLSETNSSACLTFSLLVDFNV